MLIWSLRKNSPDTWNSDLISAFVAFDHFKKLNQGDDFDSRQEFCELIMDRFNYDPQFIQQRVFLQEATIC